MDKIYKLAANFNTVDIKIDDEDLIEMLDISDEFELDESGEHPIITPELRDELTLRVLQREYDIIAAIKTVAPVAPVKSASHHPAAPKAEKTAKKPSENQIAYARSLGMKDPENSTSKEVWTYIQTHR